MRKKAFLFHPNQSDPNAIWFIFGECNAIIIIVIIFIILLCICILCDNIVNEFSIYSSYCEINYGFITSHEADALSSLMLHKCVWICLICGKFSENIAFAFSSVSLRFELRLIKVKLIISDQRTRINHD